MGVAMKDSDAARRHSNLSGLDFIHSSSNPVEPLTASSAREFATQALLTSTTRARYWQAETLTLWQAFALYCYLDPDMLGAPTPARVEYLRQVARHLNPDHSLRRFCGGLGLIASEASSVLPLIQRKDDWFDSTTSPVPFRAHLQSLGFYVDEPRGVLYRLLIPEQFICFHLAVQAYLEFWAVDNRCFWTEPRNEAIAQFIRMHGGSGALCNAISRVLRPAGAKRGRPRKPTPVGTLQDALGPRFDKYLALWCDKSTT